MHTESLCRWTVLVCHCNARLRPFTMVSTSAKFIYWASFVGRSQHASSRMSPCLSYTTLVANDLKSTHGFNSFLHTLQLPQTGSSQVNLASTSSTTRLREASSTGSSHPLVTAVTHLFRTLAITRSQLQTENWPTNFSHMEKTVRHVISAGGSGIAVPRFQHKESHFPKP